MKKFVENSKKKKEKVDKYMRHTIIGWTLIIYWTYRATRFLYEFILNRERQ